MRPNRLSFAIPFLLLLSSCMVSEQIGEEPQNLAFHFDTDFNLYLLIGRSGILAAFAYWLFKSWGKSPVPMILGIASLAYAGFLFVQGYPSLKRYRVDVTEAGLTLNIPPDPETYIPWESIEHLELAGYEWMHVPTPGVSNPLGQKRAPYAWEELPEWESMAITVAGQGTHTVNLKRLSIEQRQILSRAIVKRAHLIKE